MPQCTQFYSAVGGRPVRLSEETRALAATALSGEFGRSMSNLSVTLDTIEGVDTMSPVERYAEAIRLIAVHAPLRFIDGELLVGAATLEMARRHSVPALDGGEPVFPSISHVTPGFHRVLKLGLGGLRAEVLASLETGRHDEKGRALLGAMISCLDSFDIWNRRYLDLLRERSVDAPIIETFERVLDGPPATFREAVQALWLYFSFLRLCGNWPGIGRIDMMLGPYLAADLAEGRLTLDDARELLAHFWVKGCEWITLADRGTGDAQHYQNIVLGGVDDEGLEATNEVTYLVLDIVEELGISDFAIAVRIGRKTPERLYQRIAEVQRHGGGVVAVYNEELIIDSMVEYGYELSEARRFANDGCWEVQVPGRTGFSYLPFDMLAILQRDVLGVTGDGPAPVYRDFEELYASFLKHLGDKVESLHSFSDGDGLDGHPAALMALFMEDCISGGRDYTDRGARYTVRSPHAGGLPDTANSLLAIARLVYEEGRISLQGLVSCLRANWEGCEELRRYASHGITYFGNDDTIADAMAKRVYDDYVRLVRAVPERNGVIRPPGISTFGRQIDWRWNRGATADGHLSGEILSGNLSPAPGTDNKGATAIIKSHCSLGLQSLTGGTALDIKLLPGAVKGEKGVASLVMLLKGFIALGGFFMQTDIVDDSILRDARLHPERHQNLAVRISGWSARFVTLNDEWQDMVVERTAQGQ